jgi:hypothetical protein
MSEIHERRVSTLAHRIGLALARSPEADSTVLYHLIEPQAMVAIYPGGNCEGASLSELEDWLGFPWE